MTTTDQSRPTRIAVWSPTGGSGCTVLTVALGAAIARTGFDVALVSADASHTDDLAAVAGLGTSIEVQTEVAPRLTLLTDLDAPTPEGTDVVLVDVGTRSDVYPADQADHWLAVLRPDYLTLRRALHHPRLSVTALAAVAVRPELSLGESDFRSTLDIATVRFLWTTFIARHVDAGLLLASQSRSPAGSHLADACTRILTDLAASLEVAEALR